MRCDDRLSSVAASDASGCFNSVAVTIPVAKETNLPSAFLRPVFSGSCGDHASTVGAWRGKKTASASVINKKKKELLFILLEDGRHRRRRRRRQMIFFDIIVVLVLVLVLVLSQVLEVSDDVSVSVSYSAD